MRSLVWLACTSTISLSSAMAWGQQLQGEPAPFQILASDIQPAAVTETVFDGDASAGTAQLETAPGDAIIFRDNATASSASIINNGGETRFEDNSTASVSSLVANEAGRIDFSGSSTAHDADIVVNGGGSISFGDDADAGTSQVAINGTGRFAGRSNAALAVIVVNTSGALEFDENANAGNAQITNNGQTTFAGASSLDGALITNNEGGSLVFRDDAQGGTTSLIQNNGTVLFRDRASLGGANLVVNEDANARFDDSSDAGTNLVTVSGDLEFAGSSSANEAEIVGNAGGSINFVDDASAGDAQITSAANLRFAGRAVAANASITMGEGATISFSDEADGGSAQLHLDAGSELNIAGANGQVGLGSLDGAGDVQLGRNVLAVGNDSEREVFAGTINDGGNGGGVVKRGSGIWNLAGASYYSGPTIVESGTLEGGRENAFAADSAFSIEDGATLALGDFDQQIGSLAGSGSVDLATATLTAGGNGGSTEFSGTIDGTGSLVKTGSGELALTGTNTYSGDTHVDEGRLRVDGDIGSSAVFVGSQGTLLGSGRVGATTVEGRLLARAEGSPLTIGGDLTLGEDAVTTVEVAESQSGRFIVEGSALLGGVLIVNPVEAISVGTPYELLTATMIDGEFASIDASFAFVDPSLNYGPTALTLTFLRNDTSFESVANTPNQRATAGAVETLGSGNAVFNAVLPLSADAARDAFDNLSGEGHANALEAMALADDGARRSVLRRLRDDSTGVGVWTDIKASTTDHAADGNGAAARYRAHSAIAGVDFQPAESVRVGLAGHYTQTNLSNAARATEGDVTSVGALAYGAWSSGSWRVRAGAGVTSHKVELDRAISVGALQARASSQYSALSANVFGEVGYAFDYGQIRIEPFAGLSHLYLRTDGFNETGAGDAKLSSNGNRLSRTDAEIGVRASTSYALGNGVTVRPSIAVGYRRNLDGDRAESQHRFAQSGPFRVAASASAGHAATVEMRVDAQINRDIDAGLFYFGSFSESGNAHTIGAAVRVRF